MHEVCEVDGDVVLIVGQFAVVTLQVVSVAGVLSHPINLVATVIRSRQFGVTSLIGNNTKFSSFL